MKFLKYTPIVLCLAFSQILSAQTPHFINGSLEPKAGASTVACKNNADVQVNTMGHVWKTTDKPDSLYVGEDICTTGAAVDGHYYLGLYYSPHSHFGNRIVLELDNNMLAGNTYSFFFWYKGIPPVIGSGASMDWGTTIDSVSSGPTLGSDTSLGAFTGVWRRLNGTITPAITTKYFWVGAQPAMGIDSGIIYIDYFFMHYVGDHVEELNNNSLNDEVSVYPNPFKQSTQLSLSPAVVMPCNVAVYDMVGRLVMEKQGINNRNVPIDRAALVNGVYFLKVTDKNNNTYMTRIAAE